LIEGVIKRSRIKTAKGLGGPNGFYLNVILSCMTLGSGSQETGYTVHRQIMYGDYPLLYEKDYGGNSLGALTDKQYFLNLLKGGIENAVTDFVEVNFLSE